LETNKNGLRQTRSGSVVDRLTHKAHIIETGTESWRFRHGLEKRDPKKKGG
jgi:hypothetical protein